MNAFASPTPLHEAALAIHAMDPEDAAWLVAALPPAQSRVLTPMLEELMALGLPRGSASASVVAAARAGMTCSAGQAGRDEDRVAALVRLLAAEPRSLVHSLLAVEDWGWRDQVAAVLRVAPGERAARPPAALAAALLAACDETALAAPCEPRPPSGGWPRLRGFVRSWRRLP